MDFSEAAILAQEILATPGFHIFALYGPTPTQIKPHWVIWVEYRLLDDRGKPGTVAHRIHLERREQWEKLKGKRVMVPYRPAIPQTMENFIEEPSEEDDV